MRYIGIKWNRRFAENSGSVWTPLLMCFVALLWSSAGYADFTYSDFPDAGSGTVTGMTFNMTYDGGTTLPAWYEDPLPRSTGDPDNRLRITDDLLGSFAGSAWYNTKQIVSDGFRTTFRYKFTGVGADGMAFVIQNDTAATAALGSSGGDKGYAGISNSLAVEID